MSRGRQRNYDRPYDRDRSNTGEYDRTNSGASYGSARSDYGGRPNGGENRGFLDRAADEVASWFGDDDAERRRNRDERADTRREMTRNSASGYGQYHQDRWAAAQRAQRGGGSRNPLDELSVREVMSDDIATVRPDDSVIEAARLMRDEDCGALPVVDRYGRAVGVVTDRDITCRIVAEGGDIRGAQVRHCMTDDVFACREDSTISECVRTMTEHRVRRIIIVDERDRVVGMISQGDVARIATERSGDRGPRMVAEVVREISEPTGDPYR